MARVAYTLRIDESERAALENLSEIEGRPVNQLLNEAIKNFLMRRGPKERALDATLTKLRAYRKRDRRIGLAVDAFIEAEGYPDPLEGEVLEGKIVRGKFKAIGPAQSRIRELLDA
jgi:hypothetical protein